MPKCFMLYVNNTNAKEEHNIPKLNNEIMVVLSGIILIISLKSYMIKSGKKKIKPIKFCHMIIVIGLYLNDNFFKNTV